MFILSHCAHANIDLPLMTDEQLFVLYVVLQSFVKIGLVTKSHQTLPHIVPLKTAQRLVNLSFNPFPCNSITNQPLLSMFNRQIDRWMDQIMSINSAELNRFINQNTLYQIDFTAQDIGQRIKTSKRILTW